MAPKAFQRPPDLNTRHDEPLTPIEASIDQIILADTPHATISKLRSGTVRTDRKQATPEEIASAKAEKLARRRASNLARGSADVDGSYEPGLELKAEVTPPAQPLGDLQTVRIDHK